MYFIELNTYRIKYLCKETFFLLIRKFHIYVGTIILNIFKANKHLMLYFSARFSWQRVLNIVLHSKPVFRATLGLKSADKV